MKPLIRFGRRIPIPSTLQIRHELRTFSVEKFMREVCPESETLVADEVACRGATERKRRIVNSGSATS
jgi:hypothetical protein